MHQRLVSILNTLTLEEKENVSKKILQTYNKKGVCIVHFLYFANIILNNLNDDKKNLKRESYHDSLTRSDFLLPDGIALRTLYKKIYKKELPNLNGTDFLPFFLKNTPKEMPVEIIVYGGKEEVINKSVKYIEENFKHTVIYSQNGYKEFDWSKIPKKQEGVIRVLLVGRGSPLQEIWVEENRSNIENMECLTFSVGGLIDFWSGTEEKRAPQWIRSLHGEWLYRAITNPQKNLKKTIVSLQLIGFLWKK